MLRGMPLAVSSDLRPAAATTACCLLPAACYVLMALALIVDW
jgi:hypothetical protein